MHKLNAPFARKQGGFSIPMLIGIIGLLGIVGLAAAKFTSGAKVNTSQAETKSSVSTLLMQKGSLSAALSQLQLGATGDWTEFGYDIMTRAADLQTAAGVSVISGTGTQAPGWPVGPVGLADTPITWGATVKSNGRVFAFTSNNISLDVCQEYNKATNGYSVPLNWSDLGVFDADTLSHIAYTPDAPTAAKLSTIVDSACVSVSGNYRIVARLQ